MVVFLFMGIKDKIKDLVYDLCLGEYGYVHPAYAEICALLDQLKE